MKSDYRSVKIGDVYSRLTVLSFSRIKLSAKYFACKCICGTIKEVKGVHLKDGHTKSCGCIKSNPGDATYNSIESSYKKSASKRRHKWSLTRSEFRNLVSGKCYWCGAPPLLKNSYYKTNGTRRLKTKLVSENRASSHWVPMNGIDRVDNTKGYIVTNCVSCCAKCNSFKSDYSASEFIEHAYKIVSFQKGINEKT